MSRFLVANAMTASEPQSSCYLDFETSCIKWHYEETNMETIRSLAQCADGSLGQHRHVCAFFNDLDEEHRVLRSFFKDGFDRGEKAIHIIEVEKREDYLKRLAEAGIRVQEMIGTDRLEVLPWTDMYVRDHRFDQDAMPASVEDLIQSGAAAGYPRTRLVGHHMDWLFLDKPAVNNLVQYEARLNNVRSSTTLW
jgi:hypothetical protein